MHTPKCSWSWVFILAVSVRAHDDSYGNTIKIVVFCSKKQLNLTEIDCKQSCYIRNVTLQGKSTHCEETGILQNKITEEGKKCYDPDLLKDVIKAANCNNVKLCTTKYSYDFQYGSACCTQQQQKSGCQCDVVWLYYECGSHTVTVNTVTTTGIPGESTDTVPTVVNPENIPAVWIYSALGAIIVTLCGGLGALLIAYGRKMYRKSAARATGSGVPRTDFLTNGHSPDQTRYIGEIRGAAEAPYEEIRDSAVLPINELMGVRQGAPCLPLAPEIKRKASMLPVRCQRSKTRNDDYSLATRADSVTSGVFHVVERGDELGDTDPDANDMIMDNITYAIV